VDEISPPVQTPFGVHLIECTETKSGNRQWTDVRESLRNDLARELFERLVAEERSNAAIEYSGAWPHEVQRI
jgi:parvulin-like peptidyl-prolyl isomerase